MKKQEKPFKLPKHKQPFFSFVKKILRLFYKKPEIINLGGAIDQPAIFVSNHSARRGAVIMDMYLPVRNAKWGAYQMLGSYKERRKYLKDVFYRQKCGYGKFRSALCASFNGFFSIYFYRGMKILPTYQDARFAKSLRNSVEVLKDGTNIVIFPEYSEDGYCEVMPRFLPGFVMLAEAYFRNTKTDLPIYPVYYGKRANRLVIGEPDYVQRFKGDGMNREEIAQYFCDKVNELYNTYIKDVGK